MTLSKPLGTLVYEEGRAAYQTLGMQAINPYSTRQSYMHDLWQQGKDDAHREAFEKRQQNFINNHA